MDIRALPVYTYECSSAALRISQIFISGDKITLSALKCCLINCLCDGASCCYNGGTV